MHRIKTKISQSKYQIKFRTKRSCPIMVTGLHALEYTANRHQFSKNFTVQHLLINPFGYTCCFSLHLAKTRSRWKCLETIR